MKAIEISNLTKEYHIGQAHSVFGSLKRLCRLGHEPAKASTRLTALQSLNFSIEPGEVVGIIGHNGAGKSTLLKVLAGVTTPTSGTVAVHGKVAPLIEVGAGLHPELTGRENIYLNASILGISRAMIRALENPIIEFAELEQFADTPVKKYSSGMKIRLGFAIAAHIEADIIIVDEVLSVGDLAFQRKCFDKMEDLIINKKKTVLFVSHNIRQVKRLCTRTLLLDCGKLIYDGDTNTICDNYYEISDKKISKYNANRKSSKVMNSQYFEFGHIEIRNSQGETTDAIRPKESMQIIVHYNILKTIDHPKFTIGIHTTDFVYVSTFHSREIREIDSLPPGRQEARCTISTLNLVPGVYSLRLGVDVGKIEKNVFYGENLFHFRVIGDQRYRSEYGQEGLVILDVDWQRIA